MLYQTLTHGILKPFSWYIKPPPLHMVILPQYPNTMGRGFNMPRIGVRNTKKYHGYGDQYTMGRGFNIL
jgi:hypothetical protein